MTGGGARAIIMIAGNLWKQKGSVVPDVLIRSLDSQTLNRLKRRAKQHGRSLQGELRTILENAAGLSVAEALETAGGWRKKLGRRFEDSAELIREDRER